MKLMLSQVIKLICYRSGKFAVTTSENYVRSEHFLWGGGCCFRIRQLLELFFVYVRLRGTNASDSVFSLEL